MYCMSLPLRQSARSDTAIAAPAAAAETRAESSSIPSPSAADTNLDYVVLVVSNRWNFLGRTQRPIVITTIRNNPSILQ